jgi:ribosomal-protein-alanine N-acetyltransferase
VLRWQMAEIHYTDIEPILKIDQDSFRLPWSHILFENELLQQQSCNWVVRSTEPQNGTPIIGYAVLRLITNELHIFRIAVTPTWRRQGIASWVIKQCFSKGLEVGAKSVYLEVRPSNIPAVKLYYKLGFETIATWPNYYTDTKEDALVMKKYLKEDV